jgi:arabinose-5-phosphate isomerase
MHHLSDLVNSVFDIEIEALKTVQKKLDYNFYAAANLFTGCEGKIIVCGMGKSGLIGKKIAATFASIGQNAVFIHPSEGLHGDLGSIKKEDCFLAISNSGETDELLQILPYIKKLNIQVVALTSGLNSTLAHHANFVIDIGITTEASPIQAVPMASSVVTLAVGHALATAIIKLKNISNTDFALNHPGGSLGKKILTTAETVMQKNILPKVSINSNLRNVLMVMTKGTLGLAIVVDEQDKLLGIITDGDLRRALEKTDSDVFFSLEATDIMTKEPKTITKNTPLHEAEEIMNQFKINALIVAENNISVGVLSKIHIK